MSRREAYRSAGRAAQRKRWFRMGFAAVAIVGACVAVRYAWPPYSASAGDEEFVEAATPAVTPRSANVVAIVNGEKIMRAELAAECLRHYGTDVLESLVNKELIAAHCEQQGVTIEEQEIDAEITRLATRFQVPVEQWLAMLQKERDINLEQYRRDIIWPTIALRKLAAGRLQVTEKELREAYEMEYGPQIKARMIGIRGDKAKAIKVQQQAKANPKDFGRLARAESADAESASANGWIQPIRLHAGERVIEDVAFALKHGEVSEVISVKDDQHIILLCEGSVPARQVKIEDVAERLAEGIREGKLRDEAAELFKQLQKDAKVVNILNDEAKKKQMPGVAATINGRAVSIKALSEECLARHGKDALNGLVNRRMIEQTLRKNGVKVNGQDIDDEIADAAARMVGNDANGKPNVEKWLEQVTSEPGVTVELYVRDAVWPSVAMKALSKSQVKITDEDLAIAFESNYGQRVRCLAILLDDHRKAIRVWEMARADLTAENFGKLSAEHSTDASVRALNGEIPPIRKHGGRPLLEEEAFKLTDGQLSGVIQTDGKYVILLCQGRTSPETVTLEDVRSKLYDHVYRVKLNDAMSKLFDQMQQTAAVTNYLDESKSRQPAKTRAAASTAAAARAGSTTKR